MTFESLNEVLALLDQSSEIHSKMIKRYEDRLGVLLRKAKESNDPRLQSISNQAPSDERKKKDEKKREPGEEKGWVVLESEDHSLKIATGSESLISSNEISILFKVIETLKSKLPALESSRKLLSELPSQGFRGDRRFKIVFKDGLPKYVIPSTDAQSTQDRKFRYAEQFRIAVLK